MEKGKIVALEDRIPKLKEQRRRKANKRLVLLLILFFTMIVVIAYTQSPLSHVKHITVKGNEVYTKSELIKLSGITNDTNIWKVSKSDVTSKLGQLSEMKKAIIKIQWPNTIQIQVKEHKRVAYLKQDTTFFPVMENGKILKDRKTEIIPVNSPILFEFTEGKVLNQMVKELEILPSEILNSISEIHYSPKKTDQYHISLFMNDGFEVSATLRTFSEKMSHYPSIISQLDPNKKGIIDLEVGSYFKAFEPEVEETEVEKDKGEG
ncbi:cell division protein FtsQ [Neobacillus bataviensis LMG 21833]|uniref:Cell division protein DivIB n=1 Tax=Neobacillus bataviensis LMG 21833 TaxID=1117379 RepID=K6DE53_9BACI|nr:cell division protein FtsQ/DivIB [Neobacillus bataviensis]EKN66343.1 cell division protein FtsQ [Neobacillus bataviensis LMG 21833]